MLLMIGRCTTKFDGGNDCVVGGFIIDTPLLLLLLEVACARSYTGADGVTVVPVRFCCDCVALVAAITVDAGACTLRWCPDDGGVMD